MDLRIGPPADHLDLVSDQPIFYLESKVESALKLAQLRKYRRHGVSFLIAVTKYQPEVTTRQLERLGAFAIRWQDIHRTLRLARPVSQVDRFIVYEFIRYLEDLGMAHREDIKVDDLRRIQRVLSTVASGRYSECIPRNAFELADSSLNMLAELREDFIERHPRLSTYHRWGPGYFVWFDEEDDSARWHALGWDLSKAAYDNGAFGCRLWLGDKVPDGIWWDVHFECKKVKERERYREWSIKKMLDSRGTLDRHKLLSSLTSEARRWGHA